MSRIIQAIISALPGLVALFKAFSRREEPSSEDIAEKARSEVEELEKWREESGGL